MTRCWVALVVVATLGAVGAMAQTFLPTPVNSAATPRLDVDREEDGPLFAAAAVATGPSFSGGDISYDSLYEAAVAMVAATDTASPGDTTGGTLTINGVALGSYDFHKVTGNQTVSSFSSSDWFTSAEDDRWAFVVVDGDFTINSGQTFIPANRKLGTVIYATGAVVVDGTVSMTARGASHGSGAGNVAAGAIRIITGTYGGVTNPEIPAAGGAGAGPLGDGATSGNGVAGSAGSGGGTGGGGAGAYNAGISGAGAAGTSYAGGAGSGGARLANSATAGADGGAGSAGTSADSAQTGGGAGTPPGAGGGTGTTGDTGGAGTGGGLILFSEAAISGSGTIAANGSAGGASAGPSANGGAGSGGGTVTVIAASGSGPTVEANGGAGGSGTRSGGAGGAGTARLLTGL